MNKLQREKQATWTKATDTAIDYFADELPELGNLTAQGIVDLLGPVKDAIKDLELVEKIMKERLKVLAEGRPEILGEMYRMEVRSSTRNALDQAKTKEYLEKQGILKSYMKETEVEAVYILKR